MIMTNIINLNQLQLKEYTVSEISSHIKSLVETQFGYVRIRGEISGLKIAASGHAYFNLKDENAIIASTCWKNALAKMPAKLDEGLEVIATGKLTTYAGQSRYQLSVEHIEACGEGALMQILAKRKTKLQAEGLFDNSRKKALPFFPKTIGVVTSISGAVIKDIIHRIKDRCPLRVVIWPVSVQGENAADEITSAVNGFNKLSQDLRPDILIVARGGGSIEDLWCFNEEIVVRSIAASIIPVISAVGHETDFTLSDFAADLRAPTPTAAAEIATPVIADLKYTLDLHFNRIIKILENKIKYMENLSSTYNNALSDPKSLIMSVQQKLDDIVFSLYAALPRLVNIKLMELKQHRIDFLNPIKFIPQKYEDVTRIKNQLEKVLSGYIDRLETKITLYSSLLSSLDYKNVISRGFSIVRAKSGAIIASPLSVSIGEDLYIENREGKIKAEVLEIVNNCKES